jgi:hypothetical protein
MIMSQSSIRHEMANWKVDWATSTHQNWPKFKYSDVIYTPYVGD